jgi:hypothetical protein
MSIKTLKTTIVLLALFSLFLFALWNKSELTLKKQVLVSKELTNKVDSLQKLSDSLNMELFPVQIELGRYQVAYEIFMERNPKAASQYGDIISQETE